MDGLHDGAERAERQIRDAGERRLQHDRKRAELQRQHAAEHGRERDLEAVRRPLTASRKAAAAHQRPIDEKISDKAAVKRHVPDVRAQRHQAAVCKEQALDREDHDHGQKSRPRPEHGREQQTAAQMAGRAGAGDGVVDHLPRKHERRHDGHGRQFFGCRGQILLFFLVQLHDRGPRNDRRSGVHHTSDRRREQRICHMHGMHRPFPSFLMTRL